MSSLARSRRLSSPRESRDDGKAMQQPLLAAMDEKGETTPPQLQNGFSVMVDSPARGHHGGTTTPTRQSLGGRPAGPAGAFSAGAPLPADRGPIDRPASERATFLFWVRSRCPVSTELCALKVSHSPGRRQRRLHHLHRLPQSRRPQQPAVPRRPHALRRLSLPPDLAHHGGPVVRRVPDL